MDGRRIWMAEEMVRLLSLDHIQHASFTSVSGPFTLHGKPGFLLWVSSCRQLWGEVHIGGTRSPANLWALQVSYPGRGSTSSSQASMQADSWLSEPPGKFKNTGVGSLALLQGIFPTQESKQGLLHFRWILYQLSYQGSPSDCSKPINSSFDAHIIFPAV